MAGPGVVARIKERLREKQHRIDHATVEIGGRDVAEGDCG